jgi:plasmid maintenance system antidote protein VapI
MAARKSQPTSNLTSALQEAIANSEVSFYELERQAGVKRQSLMKFMRAEQSLRLDMADRLAKYFGLELTERKAE